VSGSIILLLLKSKFMCFCRFPNERETITICYPIHAQVMQIEGLSPARQSGDLFLHPAQHYHGECPAEY
jgi:hypothetical protein